MKYDLNDLEKVVFLINTGLNKVNAIKKAGFSDPVCYYYTLKRLNKKEATFLVDAPVKKTKYNEIDRKRRLVTFRGVDLTAKQFSYISLLSTGGTKKDAAELSGYSPSSCLNTYGVENSISSKLGIDISQMTTVELKSLFEKPSFI